MRSIVPHLDTAVPGRPVHGANRLDWTGVRRRPCRNVFDQLGTTDDCGFAPFADDTSTARATAFAKIRARVEGTQLASAQLG